MEESKQEKNPKLHRGCSTDMFFLFFLLLKYSKSVSQVVAARRGIKGQLENYTALRKPATTV